MIKYINLFKYSCINTALLIVLKLIIQSEASAQAAYQEHQLICKEFNFAIECL